MTDVVRFVQTARRLISDSAFYCGFDDAVAALQARCEHTDCTPAWLAENLTSQAFAVGKELIGLAYYIEEEFPPATNEDMYLQSLSVGMAVARVIHATFDL